MGEITPEKEVLIETVLYKEILTVSDDYVLEKMSEEYKELICSGIRLNAAEFLDRFCKEQNLDKIDVIQKVRSCLLKEPAQRQEFEIYGVIGKALASLENSLQKEKEAKANGEER